MTEPLARVTKAERTRARILESGLALFSEQGYGATTMRDIAARADCALGLLYRYFPRRESFVLALYDRITADFAADVDELPPGTLADRFGTAMHAKMKRLEPHKEAFVGLVGAALDRHSGASVLGSESIDTRERVQAAFERLVAGASDAPTDQQTREMARLLFVAHLLIVLVWTQDSSDGSQRSHRFVDLASTALRAATPMLPVIQPAVSSLSSLVAEFLDAER